MQKLFFSTGACSCFTYFVTTKMVYLARLYSDIDSGCFLTICLNKYIILRYRRTVVQFFLSEEEVGRSLIIYFFSSTSFPSDFIKSFRDY